MSRKMVFGRYDFAMFGTFIAYAVGSLVVPVALVQVARDLGFTLDEGGTSRGGWLHMMRCVSICMTLALSGFMAGRWGNRKPLGVSVALIGAGLLLCAASPTYGVLLLALMIAGLGEGVVEALGTPFTQELHPEEPGRYVNFSHGFWSVGVLVSTVLFGWLLYAGMNWRVVLVLAAAFAIVPTLLLLAPEGKKKYPERPERVSVDRVLSQAKAICMVPRFWLYFAAMFLAGGGEFCLTFWCASFIQSAHYFQSSVMQGGVGTAIFASGMLAGRTGFGFLLRQHHLKKLMLAMGVLGMLVCLAVPNLAKGAWEIKLEVFYVILFVAGIATAPFWPSLQTHAVTRLPGLDMTMVYVMLSFAGVPGCGFFTLLMGYLGSEKEAFLAAGEQVPFYAVGMANAFYIVPACFVVIMALLLLDRKKGVK